jgi:polar amino acid transport system substrate-binding protein
MRKIIIALAALAMSISASSLAHADKLADIISKGVVRIGVPVDVPPFGSQDENRNPVGFDVELAGLVGKALGVKVELQQITGANRIPYLLTDKIDIVIAVMGLTPERAKQIMFTAPYADTYNAVYGAKATAVDSAGKTGSLKIAVTKGTTQDLTLSAMNPDAVLMRTEDDATAMQAYLSGQADLLATNSLVMLDVAKKNPKVEFDEKFILDRGPAHMGVQMGEQNLLNWLNSFIYASSLNGDLDKLHRKFLDRPFVMLPTL